MANHPLTKVLYLFETLAKKRIIEDYCVGTESKKCMRKSYIEKTGQDPPDSMMPTGLDAESGKVIEF